MIKHRGDRLFHTSPSLPHSPVQYKPPFRHHCETLLLCRRENRLVILLVNNTLLKQLYLSLHASRSPLLLHPPYEHKHDETNDRQIDKLLVTNPRHHHIATLLETLRQFIVVESVVGIPTVNGTNQRNIVAMPEHS